MRKSFDEWKQMYEDKTGKPFERNKAFKLFFYPEKGFCEVGVLNTMVIAYQLCGDGWFWRRLLEFLAVSLGYDHCGTICIRRIKPYIRFWGFRIVGKEVTSDGYERYFCKDEDGINLTCSPAWVDNETGEVAYFMTWEVKQDVDI